MSRWLNGMSSLHRLGQMAVIVCLVLATVLVLPAFADYDRAKRHFDGLPSDDQFSQTLGLIATGDFAGLFAFGFTKRYYNSVLAFESREGLMPDGILEPWELARLNQRFKAFNDSLGIASRLHPVAGSKLLVPRLVFDTEQSTQHGIARPYAANAPSVV